MSIQFKCDKCGAEMSSDAKRDYLSKGWSVVVDFQHLASSPALSLLGNRTGETLTWDLCCSCADELELFCGFLHNRKYVSVSGGYIATDKSSTIEVKSK